MERGHALEAGTLYALTLYALKRERIELLEMRLKSGTYFCTSPKLSLRMWPQPSVPRGESWLVCRCPWVGK